MLGVSLVIQRYPPPHQRYSLRQSEFGGGHLSEYAEEDVVRELLHSDMVVHAGAVPLHLGLRDRKNTTSSMQHSLPPLVSLLLYSWLLSHHNCDCSHSTRRGMYDHDLCGESRDKQCAKILTVLLSAASAMRFAVYD